MKIDYFDQNLKQKYQTPESHIEVGDLGEKIREEILSANENFEYVKRPEKTLRGQPFDRLCRKLGKWYIVEIKAAQQGFVGTPSHTQKRRMREVLEEVKELEPVLLQINLGANKYKIRYGSEVRSLIADNERKRVELDSVMYWVKKTIAGQE